MAAKTITEEDWRGARRRYESEPGLGYGGVSQVLDCSRSLVAKRAQSEQWQKGIGVAESPNRPASDGIPKFTENASVRGVQSRRVHSPSDGKQGQPATVPTLPASVPAAGQNSPVSAAPAPGTHFIPEPPAGLDDWKVRDYFDTACKGLMAKQNDRHVQEQRALSADFAAEMRKPGDAGAARRIKALTESVKIRQEMERASLADWIRVRLDQVPVLRTNSGSVRIQVLIVPGLSLFGGSVDLPAGERVTVASYSDGCKLLNSLRPAVDATDVESRDV